MLTQHTVTIMIVVDQTQECKIQIILLQCEVSIYQLHTDPVHYFLYFWCQNDWIVFFLFF